SINIHAYDVLITSNLCALSSKNPDLINNISKHKHHVRLEHDSNEYLKQEDRIKLFGSCIKSIFLSDFHISFFASKKGKKYNRPNYKHSKETIEKIRQAIKKSNFRNKKEYKLNHANAMKKRKGIPNKKCWKPLKINNVSYPCAKIACKKLKISFPTLIKMMKKGKGEYIKI
ncbi:hypothetical protein EBR43_10330, partial [bacterium]|nr:hypothetical protein [bacterium]